MRRIAILSLVAFAAACSSKPAPPPPAPVVKATPVPTPPPPPAVGTVTLGNAIGADKSVATALETFGVKDTIYASVATTGTHDTDTLAAWWDTADDVERAAVLAMPWFVSLRSARAVSAAQPGSSPILVDEGFAVGSPFSDEMRDAFLELLFASGSEDVVVPLQDVFGWRDRVNVPATVDDRNWTWTLPWPIDAMASHPECLERTRAIASWCARYRRR